MAGRIDHDPTGRTGGNSRNGTRSKTVLTEIGPVQSEVPRDTDSSFDPTIVRKRQRRLTGVDQIVLVAPIRRQNSMLIGGPARTYDHTRRAFSRP
jgi:transposase-like protein